MITIVKQSTAPENPNVVWVDIREMKIKIFGPNGWTVIGGMSSEDNEFLESLKSDILNTFNGAVYKDQRIYFQHDGKDLMYLEAAPFIKDGMVDNVRVEGDNLIITFNTEAGKEPISLPIKDIFNPDNYYTKEDVDEFIDAIEETYINKEEFEEALYEASTNGYNYVDMGKAGIWATCNVGANSPEEYGLYFQWADIKGYKTLEEKGEFSRKTYKYSDTEGYTKYTDSDNLITLELEDDAAHVNMGGNWRIPTVAEQQKLLESCNIEWVSNYNGTNITGILFKLKTDDSKQLFFPTTGFFRDKSFTNKGSFGYYWLNERGNESSIRYFEIYNSKVYSGLRLRVDGVTIRAFLDPSIKSEKYLPKKEAEETYATKEDLNDYNKIYKLYYTGSIGGSTEELSNLYHSLGTGDIKTVELKLIVPLSTDKSSISGTITSYRIVQIHEDNDVWEVIHYLASGYSEDDKGIYDVQVYINSEGNTKIKVEALPYVTKEALSNYVTKDKTFASFCINSSAQPFYPSAAGGYGLRFKGGKGINISTATSSGEVSGIEISADNTIATKEDLSTYSKVFTVEYDYDNNTLITSQEEIDAIFDYYYNKDTNVLILLNIKDDNHKLKGVSTEELIPLSIYRQDSGGIDSIVLNYKTYYYSFYSNDEIHYYIHLTIFKSNKYNRRSEFNVMEKEPLQKEELDKYEKIYVVEYDGTEIINSSNDLDSIFDAMSEGSGADNVAVLLKITNNIDIEGIRIAPSIFIPVNKNTSTSGPAQYHSFRYIAYEARNASEYYDVELTLYRSDNVVNQKSRVRISPLPYVTKEELNSKANNDEVLKEVGIMVVGNGFTIDPTTSRNINFRGEHINVITKEGQIVHFSPDTNYLATREYVGNKIDDIINSAVHPEPGQILYSTYDDTAIEIADGGDYIDGTYSGATEHLVSNEYYPSKGYGIITLDVNYIPKCLIYGHHNLKSVTVSGSFEYIDDFAIAANPNLKEINIEDGVQEIRESAFRRDTSLRDLIIPDSVTTLGPRICFQCEGLTTIKLPSEITTIPLSCFAGCQSLLNVIIPEKVKEIQNQAFSFCYSLTSINCPDSLKTIGAQTFDTCRALSYINLNKVTSIGSGAFQFCNNLRKFEIPSGVTSISHILGQTLGSLDLLVIPSSVTKCDLWYNCAPKKIDTGTNFINANFPTPAYLEELTLRSTTVVENLDTQYLTKVRNEDVRYAGVPSSKLKIYVPANLVESYNNKYPTLAHRFFPIQGEQTVYAYKEKVESLETQLAQAIARIELLESNQSNIKYTTI